MTTDKPTTTASAQPENVRGFIRRDGKPNVGQVMVVRSRVCKIVEVHPFGTVDVVFTPTGEAYRVTGLNFI